MYVWSPEKRNLRPWGNASEWGREIVSAFKRFTKLAPAVKRNPCEPAPSQPSSNDSLGGKISNSRPLTADSYWFPEEAMALGITGHREEYYTEWYL